MDHERCMALTLLLEQTLMNIEKMCCGVYFARIVQLKRCAKMLSEIYLEYMKESLQGQEGNNSD